MTNQTMTAYERNNSRKTTKFNDFWKPRQTQLDLTFAETMLKINNLTPAMHTANVNEMIVNNYSQDEINKIMGCVAQEAVELETKVFFARKEVPTTYRQSN